jgi:glycosyltransferase involved in cell wall biosynthesis
MKVAIVSTHPIQYHTPWFQKLAAQDCLDLKVYYALLPDQQQQSVGFGEAFTWDIPLLEGYDWELIPNKRESPSLRGFFRSSTPAILSLLAEAKPDVVIITGWQSLPLLQALWAAIRLGIPRIVRGESNGIRSRPFLVRGLHRLLLSRFGAFLAIGKLNREFYRHYGIADERLFSCPYFVDNERFVDQFRREADERSSLRAGWNIPDGHTCFLFAGKLETKKRIMDLLGAMGVARQNCPAIHLLVAGTGDLMEEARQFAESRSLPVTFAGFLNQSQITRAYAAADCLVLPSDYGETWGLVVNEAMACGLPAIVSDQVGCAPDLVEEGVTGGVFPCGDINALAQKLQAFASDPDRLVRMGEEARQRINDYSVERAVHGTLRAIEFAVNDGRRTTVSCQPSRIHSPHALGPPWSMRVLHVIPSLSPVDGGPSFAMALIARGLEPSGIHVGVATTEGALEQRINQNGLSVFYFRRQSEFYKVSLPLWRWLSEHIRDYDLVHIHALFSYSSYAAARLAAKDGVPYIIRPLGVLNRWGMQNRRRWLKRFSFRFIERRIISNAAAIHYTSQQEKLEAEEAGVTNQSVVIPLGVDLSGFRELPGPEPFYEKFPLAHGRDIILFLSRLDPKKGLDLLLRAFAQTHPHNSKTMLVITGDGDEHFVNGLSRLADELGIANAILWTGFLGGDDKLSALAAASLFVLPSYSENFGIALVEAMAAGVPCVMSDQIGIAVDAKEYDAGLVVPCEVGALVSAMQSLIDDPELRTRLSGNARRLVDDRFSMETMADSLVKLYDQVLSGRATESDNPELSPIDTTLTSPGVAKAK